MHPALLRLMKLRIRGTARRTVRGLRTARGVLFFGFAVLALAVWLGPAVFTAMHSPAGNGQNPLAPAAPDIMPLVLMLIWVLSIATSAGERAIYFTPAEVGFLFAAPFKRRELLAFKLAMSTLGHLLTALIFSLAFLIHLNWWVAGYVGILLASLFLQLSGMAFVLTRQLVAEQVYTRTRKVIAGVVIALATVGLCQVLATRGQQEFVTLLHQFRYSWGGTCLLAPFEVFARTITAESLFPGLAGWGGLALAIDLALLGVVMLLDANYLEVAAAVSEKIYARRQRMRRGGGAMALSTVRAARWHLPQPAWLGGAGPILWLQLTQALRSSRQLLMMTVFVVLISGTMTLAVQKGGAGSVLSPLAAIGGMVYATFFATMQVALGFRGDLDRMDWLKALPLRPVPIAWGELAGFVLVLTVVQTVFFCCMTPFVEGSVIVFAVAVAFAAPFNLVLFAVENLVFLLFPTRVVPASPGDLQFMGRHVLFLLLKTLAILACLGAAAGPGAIAFWLSGESCAAFATVGWIVLVLEAVALVYGVAWAFRRFDVSVDTPA